MARKVGVKGLMASSLSQDKQGNRIFYLSIPPSIFTDVAACASKSASSKDGWTRVIVEKPFGKDSDSFNRLSEELYQHLTEDQMYRIDHYLGKELIENLTVSLFKAFVSHHGSNTPLNQACCSMRIPLLMSSYSA